MRPWIRRLRFSWIFAPGGRLSYEAYDVEVSKYHQNTIFGQFINKTNAYGNNIYGNNIYENNVYGNIPVSCLRK